ncbi:hypothetical protein EVJ58_g3023 [Rhodofomes roseus]|uniref:Uncharacterized protein n=1 Tax=Rhodofomes roseus TaxID=34475 RepID=A0A4Y9YN44_9APHY|nr:hypothetical protein EVJ58_g3023 [Rhodofomes roseus]
MSPTPSASSSSATLPMSDPAASSTATLVPKRTAVSSHAAPPAKNFEEAYGTLSASYGWGMTSDAGMRQSAKAPKQAQQKPSSGFGLSSIFKPKSKS